MSGTHNTSATHCIHGRSTKVDCHECAPWYKPKDEQPIVIDTPDGIAAFAMLQVIACLSIEVKTGMVHSQGSVLKLAQRRYGCTSRTKKGALAEMRVKYTEATGLVCKVGLR